MKNTLKLRYLAIVLILFYRFSVGTSTGTFLGVDGHVYLIAFCFMSLLLLGMDIFLYWKKKDYYLQDIQDWLEIFLVFLCSVIIIFYSGYIFIKDRTWLFAVISGVYLLQVLFWGFALVRSKRKTE